MATSVDGHPIWNEIDLAESYLVCAMWEEAISSSSGVIKRLHDKDSINGVEVTEFFDMLQAAGMVLVQSFEKLGRSLEIFNELIQLYGPQLPAIPNQVFLVGACFYMQEDAHGAQKLLEVYLSKWEFVNGEYHVRESVETNDSFMNECSTLCVLDSDSYLQVVEAYISLHTRILNDTNHVISWVEKASLPDHTRQELLRRLWSINSSEDTGAQASMSANVTSSASVRKEEWKQVDRDAAAKEAIIRYSSQNVSPFWWFRKINLRYGSFRIALSNGSILMTALMLLVYIYTRRKKYTITSILKGQAQLVKKTALDLWQLAFSFQVNPLAAVDTLPHPNRISR